MAIPAPRLSRFPRLPLIWIVPVVALAIAAWMIYREQRSNGLEITISFSDASGLEPRQTKLEYRGIPVGEVKSVRLNRSMRRVLVRVRLAKNATAVAREGARFWIVEPQFGFNGVSGLDTLLGGAKLAVRLGDGPPTTYFRGLDAPPAIEQTEEGRAFLLKADRVGGLQVRAPVFYRDIKVGEVESARLADDATMVLVRIRIQSVYVPLVRANTRFWNAGGAPFEFRLFGGGTQKKSLQSIITGAVGFATPDDSAEIAPDGSEFTLAKEADDDWLKWRPAIPIKAIDPGPEKPEPNVVPGWFGRG
jgi:paraquat-inducible protein B